MKESSKDWRLVGLPRLLFQGAASPISRSACPSRAALLLFTSLLTHSMRSASMESFCLASSRGFLPNRVFTSESTHSRRSSRQRLASTKTQPGNFLIEKSLGSKIRMTRLEWASPYNYYLSVWTAHLGEDFWINSLSLWVTNILGTKLGLWRRGAPAALFRLSRSFVHPRKRSHLHTCSIIAPIIWKVLLYLLIYARNVVDVCIFNQDISSCYNP